MMRKKLPWDFIPGNERSTLASIVDCYGSIRRVSRPDLVKKQGGWWVHCELLGEGEGDT